MRCRLWCALCLHIALVCNLHIPAAWHGTGFCGENQIVKLKRRSDPSTGLGADNRMYYEPSAQRRIQFYFGQVECYQSIFNLLPCRDKCTGFMYNYAIMVESKNYYVHPVQSWWSIAILALAVGKRTEPLVGVRYIYLRKMSSYGGELRMLPRHLYGRIQYQA